jgi:Domain of Unknown Function (DUF928)
MRATWHKGLKRAAAWLAIGLLALGGMAAQSQGQEAQGGSDGMSGGPPPRVKPPGFVYQPPNRGAPGSRVGGGTRSIHQLLALAPPHVGLSSSDQPRLYWYQAPGFRNRLRFRLGMAGAPAALVDAPLDPQINGGIHHVDLARYGIHLAPGHIYNWWIVLEPDPYQSWTKVVSGGSIELAPPDPNLELASVQLRPYLAARHGLWYDALDGISRLVDDQPDSTLWRLQRAQLLEQGSLMEAAAYDRDLASPQR